MQNEATIDHYLNRCYIIGVISPMKHHQCNIHETMIADERQLSIFFTF